MFTYLYVDVSTFRSIVGTRKDGGGSSGGRDKRRWEDPVFNRFLFSCNVLWIYMERSRVTVERHLTIRLSPGL